jgi:adenylate kinase family enzyme
MNRLNVYEQQTSALKAYFSQLGILFNVSGSGSIDQIQRQVSAILESGGIGDHSKIS